MSMLLTMLIIFWLLMLMLVAVAKLYDENFSEQ